MANLDMRFKFLIRNKNLSILIILNSFWRRKMFVYMFEKYIQYENKFYVRKYNRYILKLILVAYILHEFKYI